MKGMDEMASVTTKINRIIKTPLKKPTRAEAAHMLRACGILDKNNNVKPEYRQIVVERTKENEFRIR